MTRLGDTKSIEGAVCKLVEICDEPNTGLVIVEHTRYSCPDHVHNFTMPFELWEAIQAPRDYVELVDLPEEGDGHAGRWMLCSSCGGSWRPETPELHETGCPVIEIGILRGLLKGST